MKGIELTDEFQAMKARAEKAERELTKIETQSFQRHREVFGVRHYEWTGTETFIDLLTAEALTLKAVLAEARKAIDKLPKTADGHPIYPGMRLYRADIMGCGTANAITSAGAFVGQHNDIWCADYCYSNIIAWLEAAEAAKEKEKGEASAK